MVQLDHDLVEGQARESADTSQPALSAEAATPPIFVVDDEPLVGEVIEMVLELEGYQTQLYQNPLQALQAFGAANPRPKLLVTDFSMARLNGLQLIELCLKLEPGLKTILISGNVSEDATRHFPVQPNHFLIKPFPPKLLAGLVADLMA